MLALGIFSFRASHELIGAPPVEQWETVLRADPANEQAIDAIMSDPKERAKYPNMGASLDVCIRRSPAACGCLTNRALLRLAKGDAKGATTDIGAAEAAQCARDAGNPPLRITAARAFAAAGETDAAEAELESAKDRDTDAALIYVDALVHQQRGDVGGAETLARKASEKGAGRDANLLLASLLMSHDESDEARTILQTILREHPKDADATYDLALLADRVNDYNGAREGYLRALDLDPHKSDARYNLALLTLRQGVLAESQHHAQRFVESYPDDPRGEQLLKITGANRNSQ
jgi:tetratricopeptide (TPR) repeat protein